MCNLYRLNRGPAEVAKWFAVTDALSGRNFASEVFPGQPGAVVAEGRLQAMVWGFPYAGVGKSGQTLKPRPVNNARSDKLEGSFWRPSFAERRCLIPLTAWAEAEGVPGTKRRSWLSRPDVELFAAAGVWRQSAEWGAVYAMVMTDAAGLAAQCHQRMPVLLHQGDWSDWCAGPVAAARALCKPWDGALALDRTEEPWSGWGQNPR